jgi:hypothetical protein
MHIRRSTAGRWAGGGEGGTLRLLLVHNGASVQSDVFQQRLGVCESRPALIDRWSWRSSGGIICHCCSALRAIHWRLGGGVSGTASLRSSTAVQLPVLMIVV